MTHLNPVNKPETKDTHKKTPKAKFPNRYSFQLRAWLLQSTRGVGFGKADSNISHQINPKFRFNFARQHNAGGEVDMPGVAFFAAAGGAGPIA